MTRSGAFLSVFILLTSICFSTASRAEGFFEMLFGGGRQHSESHANYAISPPTAFHHAAHRRHMATHRKKTPHYAFGAKMRHHHQFARHKVAPSVAPSQLAYAAIPSLPGVPVEEKKCCDNAQDAIAKVIRDDPTLRPGDAYMSPDGLRVYEGDRASDQKFVPVGQARALDQGSRARLAAVEKAPQAPRDAAANSRPVAGVLSHAAPTLAQKSAKLGKERLIKTLSGKTIRFVGGYAG